MHLPSHLAISWLIGHRLGARRDRVLVAWAGVVSDLDAATALGGEELYSRWHHVLTHGLVSAVIAALVMAAFANAKRPAFGLALLAFHGHLACDLLGSGRAWGITYLYPFSRWELFTPYGWELASWQNVAITAVVLAAIGWVGLTRGHTFVEAWLPARADRAVVSALRARFHPASGG